MNLKTLRFLVASGLLALIACGGGGGGVTIGTSTEASGLVISEVSSCYFVDSECWFEIHNTGRLPVDLSQMQIRTLGVDITTINNVPSVFDTRFSMPAVTIPADGYVIVSANYDNRPQVGTQHIKLRSGSLIPVWKEYGFFEILKNGVSIDFVKFGNHRVIPTNASAWTGASVAALPSGPNEYGRSIVRPYANGTVTNTHSATDWLHVDWATPAGRNDVPAGAVDADNDGIPDSAEVLGGTFAGLDLYAMGARTGTRNLFLEVDQMRSSDAGVVIRKDALQKVVDAFAVQGIVVAFDAGTAFSASFSVADFNLGQGTHLVEPEPCVHMDQTTCNQNISHRRSIYDWKDENMDLRRRAVFHYALFAQSLNADGSCGSGGIGEVQGNDFIVTLGGCKLKTDTLAGRNLATNAQAATLMHEIGHNLGLRHGGFEDQNYKPNHWSVMNYLYSLYGLAPDARSAHAADRWLLYQRELENINTGSDIAFLAGSPLGDPASFVIDYSNGSSADLDETALSESNNIGRGANENAYADWDRNGALTASPLNKDLNGNTTKGTLKDYDEWANLKLPFGRNDFGNTNRTWGSVVTGSSFNPITKDRQPYVVEDPHHFRFEVR
ncbi:MAG: zinc-dependent metalloprotease family protein [Alphaproteobacteria bacterium]|nr:zinc-dependent metalloprotease family protein [Alphaproteobacteria bacterium]MDI9329869.1 zinc-dependent metalloprotease family protein [Alphaproteobacteria bacterium]